MADVNAPSSQTLTMSPPGIVTRTNIDYVERIWEEFTQSIHTFIEDKHNLSRHTSRKKKTTLIVIPSIRFTKLIIHHLQRKHRFHPRLNSLLHLSNEEPILGYLKFSTKGTKREIFGMPIPGRLITAKNQKASYYQEYQENVAKQRGFLADETGSTQDLPTQKPDKPAGSLTKSQENKRKQATGTTDKPAKAKRIKHSISRKTRQPISSPKSVGASEAEEVPAEKPQVADEDADYQKVVEESMKDAYALPKGLLPPVVIREPESGKYQPLPEVPGKGKAKVTEEQAGSNPDETYEGQARPNPGNAEARVQSTLSFVAYVGSNREHMDLDVANVSPQPSTEQLDEGFTANVYLNVQENLKLAVEEPVLLEEPASSSGTLSSLQHLSRDFSFGDQFFSDKHSDADKNAETEVESMVNVTIQHAMSSISLMTSPIIDLTSRPESPKEHQQLKATTTDTTTTTTTTLPPPQAPQQSTTEAMMVKHIAPLRNRFRDLPEADMKEILHQCMWESDSYKFHKDHMQLFEALEKSMNRDHSEELAHDLAEARKKRKKGHESPKTPPGSPSHQLPPPPPPAGPSGTSGAPRAFGSKVTPPPPPHTSTNQDSPSKGSAAPSPLKTAATTEHQAWTTPDITLKSLISLTPADLDMDVAMGPNEQAQLSDEEDIESAYIPTVTLRQGWWKPFEEERPTTPKPAWSIRSSDLPTGDIATFMDWFCKRQGITELKPQDLEGPAYEIVKVFHPYVIHLQYQMEECHKLLTDSVDDPILRHNVNKPLPIGGLPGQVTIQSDFFFNKDLEYLRYGSKGRRPTLFISKMKATYYLDVGLEQTVSDQFWIKEECKYDIAAMYGISHWWFQRQQFYIDRHTSEERDFKYLYPSDFEDLNLLNLQGHLNHLLPKDKKILTTAVNQWTRQLVIRQRVEDFHLGIESYQTQKMMRFNEIHKFSDGTLQQIVKALDYRVKEFRIDRLNPEAFEDMENLPQPGELYWRTRQRWRLQTFEAYQLIKLFQHSQPLSDDL
nr:hypothetical protein [Tanacetum cinerariifolium]